MVGRVRLEPGGDLAHPEHVDEEARQLVRALGERLGLHVPVGPGGKQPRIVFPQHPGTAPGRRDDVVERLERLDGAHRNRTRVAGVAAVVRGLAAASLRGRHLHGTPRILEQLDGREADRRTEEVDEAGDEQSDTRVRRPVTRRM